MSERTRISVVDKNGTTLMPMYEDRSWYLIRKGKAHRKYNKLGIPYIQLTYVVEKPDNQRLVLGIDPGSKWEGYSVVGERDTVLNIMAEATDGKAIQKKLEARSNMRGARRHRKWRRPMRTNRLVNEERIPPSTRARWELKFRIIQHLCQILPITHVVVEDVKAETRKNGKQWNGSFSPVQAGKNHLYNLIRGAGLRLITYQGYETAELRDEFGLKKNGSKAKKVFETHAQDAWVMAAAVSGAVKPTTKALYYVTQVTFKRRQLHKLQPARGGIRRREGGTRSLGLKRGTLVRHIKYGLCSVGGHMKGRISLHDYLSNKRLTQSAKVEDCTILTWTPFRSQLVST